MKYVCGRRKSKSNKEGRGLTKERRKGYEGGEFSNCWIGWEKPSEEGEERGRPGCSVFCPVTCGAPWEPSERWAASRPLLWFHAFMLFALRGANGLSIAQNTRHVLFIMMILSYNCAPGAHYINAVLALWKCSSPPFSLSVSVSLYLFYLHLPLTSPQLFVASPYLPSSLSQRVPSPIVLPISWLTSHFPFLHCASLSFILP